MSEESKEPKANNVTKSRKDEARQKKKEEERIKKEAENKKKAEEKIKRELDKKKKDEEKLLEKKKKEEERIKREQEKEDEKRKKDEERMKKEKEKETEKKLKEAERLKREEERLRKKAEREEEFRKKEEERIRREREEEDKQKKQKRQSALLLNFVVKENKDKDSSLNPVSIDRPQPERFMQFILKKDQKLASINRVEESIRLEKVKRLDAELNSNPDQNIIKELKSRKPLTHRDTWPLKKPDDIVYLEEIKDEGSCWLKAKLFQFVENNRPAYYGSWRQRSSKITGRNPFKMDEEKLNYDIDSDEEWEEDEPGESIASSENEEEEEEKEESDEDDFLVPHGYLSDDEGVLDDEASERPVTGLSTDDKMKALRQKLSVAVYEAAHERSSQKIHPKLFGCLWIKDEDDEIDNELASDNKENIISMESTQKVANSLNEKVKQVPFVKRYEVKITEQVLLMFRAFVWPNETVPIKIMNQLPEIEQKVKVKKVKSIPDECIPYLVALVHGSPISRKNLVFEFRSFWHKKVTGKLPVVLDFKQFTALNNNSNNGEKSFVEHLPFSQALVSNKIFEIASFGGKNWIVKDDIIAKYREEAIKLLPENEVDPESHLPTWKFVTHIKKKGAEKKDKNLQNKTDDELNKSGIVINKDEKSGTPVIERKRSNANEFFQPKGKKQCL